MAKMSKHETLIRRELAESRKRLETSRDDGKQIDKEIAIELSKTMLLESLLDVPDDDDKGGDNGEG